MRRNFMYGYSGSNQWTAGYYQYRKGGVTVGKRCLRFLCPNGHLGFAPIRTESFYRGVQARPHFIAADSGSCDIGPGPLGMDSSCSPLEWQMHDLEHMLLASRRLGVPMIVGSAGDTGTNSRVDLYVNLIKEIAIKHKLPKFKIGYFYSEVSREYLADKIKRGETIRGLDGRSDLTVGDLERTDRIVAMAGIHPYVKLLDLGADVIIGGRSCDIALFAAPAIRAGFPDGLAYYLGKVLECASFCAEPYGGKESVIGTITDEEVFVTAMHPGQRCTVASVAGHAMYERSNPFYESVPGGKLDMTQCVYEQFDERTTRVTGARFIPSDEIWVKLEGSGKVGERYVGFAGVRDPYTITHIDAVIHWARSQVEQEFGTRGYQLFFHVYGRDGIMGEREPLRDRPGHELLVVVESVAPSQEVAYRVCITAVRQMFYARLPEVKGTAGSVAFLVDEVLRTSPAYAWTINHVVRVDDPLELFPVFTTEAGV